MLSRTAELEYLNQFYNKESSQMVVVYGKKGVGKHTLLGEFCKDKPVSIYEARPCSEREQLYQWGGELRELQNELPEYPKYNDIMEVLTNQPSPKKIIIVYEFQNLVKQGKSFFHSVKEILHNKWSNQSVFIVLVSSVMGWVENSMITKIGDSAFDISGFLKVQELRFLELFEYFEEYSMEQCIESYSILGGIPELWQYFDKNKSVKENIVLTLLEPRGSLIRLAEYKVAEELRETALYDTILSAIAAGRNKLNDLYIHTGFSRAKISVYLKNLIELELVEKVFSYDSAGRENTQKGIYRISNHLVHFYFRYIYPHKSNLSVMAKDVFYETYIQPDLSHYVSFYFSKACREYMERLDTYHRSGEWVGKIGTIDFIAKREDGHTLIVGCCYESAEMTYEDYEWLLFCANKAKVKVDEVYLFSMHAFDDKLKEEAKKEEEKVHLIEWRNLYI